MIKIVLVKEGLTNLNLIKKSIKKKNTKLIITKKLNPKQDCDILIVNNKFSNKLIDFKGIAFFVCDEKLTIKKQAKNCFIKGSINDLLSSKLLNYIINCKQLEKKDESLINSEKVYHTLFENANDIIMLIDTKGKIININNKVSSIIGYKTSFFIGKSINKLKVITKDSQKIISKNFSNRIKGIKIPPYEIEIIKKDGSHVIFETNGNALFNNGIIIGDLAILRDVTQRKLIKKELIIEKDRAEKLLDIANVILLLLDKKGRIKLLNKKGEDMLGRSFNELKDKNWFNNCIPLSYRAKVKRLFLKNFNKKIKLTEFYENPIINKQGKERLISWHNTRINNDKGAVIGVLSSGEDITNDRITKEALKQSKELYQSLFANSNDLIYSYDIKGSLIEVNNSWLKELKYNKNDLSKFNIKQAIHPESIKLFEAVSKKAFSGSNVNDVKLTLLTKEGQKVFVKGNVLPILNNNKITGTWGVFKNITEQLRTDKLRKEEIARREELKQLKALDELKTEFLSSISHELRTPLTPISAQLQRLISKTRPKKEVNESLNMILRNVIRLDKLIKDVLDISRIKSKHMRIFKKKIRLENIINESISTIMPLADINNINIMTKIKHLPLLLVDDDRIKQVFINLLDNAIKHSGTKLITVSAERKDNNVIVCVQDKGKGFPTGELKHLFDSLYFKRKNNKSHTGAGLGLSICKGIIEAHNGQLWVNSQEGKGATFCFSLPLKCYKKQFK
ncbi:MAG: PAS domain S-box protein [Candidatus Nanoarchaeia archaeon]|jgi:PAS domain S-box-containing protein